MAATEAINTLERAKRIDNSNTPLEANEREVNRPYNKFAAGIKYGIVAGIIVGIYQFLLNAGSDGINIGWGLVGFFLMAPVIWYALRDVKAHYAAGEFFKNAAITVMYLSFFAGLVTILISVVGYAVGTGDAPEILSVGGITPGQIMANGVFQLVIGLVIGNTIGFIFMQGMKTDVVADEFIEQQS